MYKQCFRCGKQGVSRCHACSRYVKAKKLLHEICERKPVKAERILSNK